MAARGERGVPAEQMLRDMRINRIFEGSSEIMRLFIAREAVDAHLSAAGELIDPQLPATRRARAAARAGGFYAKWLPTLVTGEGQRPGAYSEFGRLAAHLRYVERASRKLARVTFYGMARWQGRLERKQGFLGRIVDIGAELFAISAVCVRARLDTGAGGAERAVAASELADLSAPRRGCGSRNCSASSGPTPTQPTGRWRSACSPAGIPGWKTASSTRRFPGRGSPPPSRGRPRQRMCTATSADTPSGAGNPAPGQLAAECAQNGWPASHTSADYRRRRHSRGARRPGPGRPRRPPGSAPLIFLVRYVVMITRISADRYRIAKWFSLTVRDRLWFSAERAARRRAAEMRYAAGQLTERRADCAADDHGGQARARQRAWIGPPAFAHPRGPGAELGRGLVLLDDHHRPCRSGPIEDVGRIAASPDELLAGATRPAHCARGVPGRGAKPPPGRRSGADKPGRWSIVTVTV